jgi:hypothetical protein
LGGCAFVCVFVICSSLVSGGFQCPKHKHAVCFWLCYADVFLIMLSNMVHVRVLRHNTEPRVLPYKLAAIVHVPSNDVCLTPQKSRFPILCIKPHLIAAKNCRPYRPVRSCPAVKSEKDAQKLQYFLWIYPRSTDFRVLRLETDKWPPPCAVNPCAGRPTRTAKQTKCHSHHVFGYCVYHLGHASLAVWLV